MSQDVNSDWQNRTFVEGIEMAMRKCVDFLSDFHEQAKFRLSEVDQRLTSLERKVDFVEAQLANADPTQRNAKPKAFEGSTFDPQVRREQVKKFRERLHKTEKVFSDRVIAPKKADGKGGKLIVNKAPQSKKAGPTEIIGAPKIQGKGNIPIKQLQKQQSESKEMEKAQAKPKAIAVGGPGGAGVGQPPPSKSPPKSPPQPGGPGGAGPGGAGPGASPKRAPPSAAQAQAAMAAKKMGGPGAGPGGPGGGPGAGPGAGPGGPPAVPKPPGPPAVPQPPKPQQQPPKQPPVPKPPQPGGEGEGTYPTDGGGDGGDGFPHGDPNAIDLLIIKPGDGNVPGGKSKVEIKYTGFLADGSKFIEHQEVISLGLKQNIKGLEAGVQRMQEGTFAKLWIPSKLGYGVRGAPPLIPENADLTFEITILRIVD